MKTFFTRILSTALCFILAFAVIQPAFAEGTDDFVDYDAPYIAFYSRQIPTASQTKRRSKPPNSAHSMPLTELSLVPPMTAGPTFLRFLPEVITLRPRAFGTSISAFPAIQKSDLSPFARIFTARSMFPVRPFSKSRLMQTAARISPPLSLTTAQALHRFSS